MYSDDTDPNWFWIERPIEYFIDTQGHCRLKRWMYLSCSALFQIRSVDVLSHGELNDNVIMLYMSSADQYYANLREQELEERDIPDSLEDAETPTEDDFLAATASEDDATVATPPPLNKESKPKSKRELVEEAARLLRMLRHMPVTDKKH